MNVQIVIGDVANLSMKTVKGKDAPEPVTTVSFQTKMMPSTLARLLNLQRQGVPLMATLGSPQALMDLEVVERKEQIEMGPAEGEEDGQGQHGESQGDHPADGAGEQGQE